MSHARPLQPGHPLPRWYRTRGRCVCLITWWTPTARVVAVTPSPSDLFADTRGIPVQVALEWMAQASAAWSTLQPREGGTPRQGMLLGARRFDASIDHLPFNRALEIVLTVDAIADSGLGTFDAILYPAGEDPEDRWLARANLSVLQTDAA